MTRKRRLTDEEKRAIANGRTAAGVVRGDGNWNPDTIGVTKREHMAAIALQGLLSSGPPRNVHNEEDAKSAALTFGITAVAMADALLLALEITPED